MNEELQKLWENFIKEEKMYVGEKCPQLLESSTGWKAIRLKEVGINNGRVMEK